MATAAVALAPILWSVTKVLITSITTIIANEAIKNCLNKTVEEIDKHHDWSDQQKFNALKEKLENIDELKENIDKIEGLDKDVSEKLKSLLNDKWCDCLSKFDASNVSNDNLQKLYKLAFSKFKPSNMNDTHILGMYDCELNKVTQNVDNRMGNLNNQVHNNNNTNTLLNQDNDNNRMYQHNFNK
ncbi:hypothetical protein ABK040_016673 [Willaertia magna]